MSNNSKPFKRSRAMFSAIALAVSEFAHNSLYLNAAVEEISINKIYKSRGKGGKGKRRGKLLGFFRNKHNNKPHEGRWEVARRLRGTSPIPVPQRKWYADPGHLFGFTSKRELIHSAAYKATPKWARTPVHLV